MDSTDIYPTTRMVTGEITAEEQLEEYIDFLINELHYGRRLGPNEIVELAILARDKIVNGDLYDE